MIQPTRIERVGDDRLQIAWSDGAVREYRIAELRAACPCATCREQRNMPEPPPTELPVLSQAEIAPLTILGMEPVGNYAYTIQFSDGHDTGIFEFDLLVQLGSAVGSAVT